MPPSTAKDLFKTKTPAENIQFLVQIPSEVPNTTQINLTEHRKSDVSSIERSILSAI